MRHRFASLAARSCSSVAFSIALSFLATNAFGQAPEPSADALLAIDQQRANFVERIVTAWGPTLATSAERVSIDELRERLMSLRADALLAASLAGTEEALRTMTGLPAPRSKPAPVRTKALGDVAADVVYTPVTPCRLVETRGTFPAVYQGDGTASHTPVPFAPNQIRSYIVQSGNGVCTAQLPAGVNPSAVQLQVFGMPTTSASGDIEILPQGAAFGSTATMVYIGTIAFNTVSTAARVNTSNHQISVQVRGGGANVAIDVVGYFSAPSGNAGRFFMQGGNAFGTTARLGTLDSQPLELAVDNQRALRIEPGVTSPNWIAGFADNGVYSGVSGATIGGGGLPGNLLNPGRGESCVLAFGCINAVIDSFGTIGGGAGNVAGAGTDGVYGPGATVGGGINNWAYGAYATVPGGNGNTASGWYSLAAGFNARATGNGEFVWADHCLCAFFDPSLAPPYGWGGLAENTFNARATGGFWFVTGVDAQGRPTWGCTFTSGSGPFCSSDRNLKRNLVALDGSDVLAKLVAMPIYAWQPKDGPNAADRHIGPMAQDFYATFELGHTDKAIGLQDEAGVALAAIRGLHEIVAAKDAKIDVLERRLDAQQRALDEQQRLLQAQQRAMAGLQATIERVSAQVASPHVAAARDVR